MYKLVDTNIEYDDESSFSKPSGKKKKRGLWNFKEEKNKDAESTTYQWC